MATFMKWSLVVVVMVATITWAADPELEEEELRALDFMRYLDGELKTLKKSSLLARFNFETNFTKPNKKAMNQVLLENGKRQRELWQELRTFSWRNYKDPNLKRQFKLLSNLGVDALSESRHKKLLKVVNEIKESQLSTKICDYEKPKACDLRLTPGILSIFKSSRNADKLQYTYTEFLDNLSSKIVPLYKEYVELRNEASKLNGFVNTLQEEEFEYETPDLRRQFADLYSEIKPLYALMHAYIRHKLRENYGDIVSRNGPIPIHLTGGLNGESFVNLYNLTMPFALQTFNFTGDHEIDYNGTKMFKLADEFYKSLNLSAMPESFWNHSVFHHIQEPHCASKVYDIEGDPRVKFCNEETVSSLQTAHEMIGSVQYLLSFGRLPHAYAKPPNRAVFKAVGQAVGLAAISVENLEKLGILNNITDQIYINHAYYNLLSILPMMSFSYAMSTWEAKVFNDSIAQAEWNCRWWKTVEELQGLEAPGDRTNKNLDVSAAISDASHSEAFVSRILQFQFFKGLCQKANKTKGFELHKCNFRDSAHSGNTLREMMRLGSTRPWPDLIRTLSAHNYLDSGPLLEYFKPLQLWLEEELERLHIPVGWIKSTRACH